MSLGEPESSVRGCCHWSVSLLPATVLRIILVSHSSHKA
jgi:hypothetical protein